MGGSNGSSCPLPTADLPRLPDFQYAPIYRPYAPEEPKGPPVQLYVKGKGEANDVDASDLQQRGFNTCFFMASLAAILRAHPDPNAFMRDIIKDNGNGTYTVTFYDFTHGDRRLVEVTVNTEFSGKETESDERGERWPAIIEKAYVKAYGDCGDIKGGSPGDAMARLTGIESSNYALALTIPPLPLPPGVEQPKLEKPSLQAFDTALKNGNAVTFLTFDKGDEGTKQEAYQKAVYAQQIHAHHTYSLTGVDTEKGTVTVRNPWDQKQDIVIPYSEAQKLFITASVNSVQYAGPKDPSNPGQMLYPAGMPSYPQRH